MLRGGSDSVALPTQIVLLAAGPLACDNRPASRPAANTPFHGWRMQGLPLADKVVIKRLDAETRTAGGIVLPDSAKEKPQQGRVLSVGDGRVVADGKRVKCQVHEGDRVVFSAWSGTEIKVDGSELLILKEEDILAIMD